MRFKILSIIIFFLLILDFSCYDGEDITGHIKIDYSGDWSAAITLNYQDTSYSGTGERIFTYNNPDTLKIVAEKLDSTRNKLIVYIYEEERIVASDSTRMAQGSVEAEYEFPF